MIVIFQERYEIFQNLNFSVSVMLSFIANTFYFLDKALKFGMKLNPMPTTQNAKIISILNVIKKLTSY
jgi:hypothetical protein